MFRSPLSARIASGLLLLAASCFLLAPSPATDQARGEHPTALSGDELDVFGAVGGLAHGDCDDDGDIDLVDWECAELCASGPDQSYSSGCGDFDFDEDLDVDLRDMAEFQDAYTGPICPCNRDVDRNGVINLLDQAKLVGAACWNRPASFCPGGDINCSGFVDQGDLDCFQLASWCTCGGL